MCRPDAVQRAAACRTDESATAEVVKLVKDAERLDRDLTVARKLPPDGDRLPLPVIGHHREHHELTICQVVHESDEAMRQSGADLVAEGYGRVEVAEVRESTRLHLEEFRGQR